MSAPVFMTPSAPELDHEEKLRRAARANTAEVESGPLTGRVAAHRGRIIYTTTEADLAAARRAVDRLRDAGWCT